MKRALVSLFALMLFSLTLCGTASRAHAATILIVTDRADLEQGTAGLAGYLRSLGHDVEVSASPGNASEFRTLDPAKIARMEGKDLVIIHRATNSGEFSNDATERTSWNNLNVPVLLMSPFLARAIRWNWSLGDISARAGFTDHNFIQPNHPIVSGLTPNMFTVGRNYDAMNGTNAGNGRVIATAPSSGSTLVVWPDAGSGTAFFQGSSGETYRKRRTFLAIHNYHEVGAFTDLSENGKQIIARAVLFTMNGSLGPLPPQFVNLSPAPGALFYNPANRFSVTITNAEAINPEAIQLFINGTNVTGSSVVGGDPLNRTVTYSALETNKFYTALLVATNANGSNAIRMTFDTLREADVVVIEAEDYNYGVDGSGNPIGGVCAPGDPAPVPAAGGGFQDNPPPSGFTPGLQQVNGNGSGYLDVVGVRNVDYSDTGTVTGDASVNSYRTCDPVGVRTTSDYKRPKYTNLNLATFDLELHQVQAGEWLNYTRTFPAGVYNVYLRTTAGAAQTMRLDRVNGDRSTTGQTTTSLGNFILAAGGAAYVPLTDVSGQPLRLSLSGTTTLRLNALSAANNVNPNFLVFIPTGESELPPSVVSVSPLNNGMADGDPQIRATILNGTSSVVPGSVRLFLNGAEVTGSTAVTPTANGAIVTYSVTNLLPSLSSNSVRLVFSDDAAPSRSHTNVWSFRVNEYVTVPTSYAAPFNAGQTRGFVIKVRNAPTNAALAGNLARAENHLRDLLLDPSTGQPWVNLAAGSSGDGSAIETDVLNYQQAALAEGYFTSANGKPDRAFPNVPTSPLPDYISLEAGAYLKLRAGLHRFGVRSDDGFRVTIGPVISDTNLVVGQYDAGRGAGGTSTNIVPPIRTIDSGTSVGASEFEFHAPIDGLYAVRLLFFEGTGGSSLEFYSVDRATERRILINDSADPAAVEAYQSRTSGPSMPSVTSLYPAPGMTNAPDMLAIRATIVNGQNPVNAASVTLQVDGTDRTSGLNVSNTANGLVVTSATLTLAVNADHTARLVFADSVGTRYTNAWTFHVVDIVPPTVAITSPVNGAKFSAPATVTVTANATDNAAVARVEFFLNVTNKIGEGTTAPYSATVNNLPEGRYVVSARATDTAGLSTTSAQVSFTVGNPPTNVLFITSNLTLPAGDVVIRDALVARGYSVEVVAAPQSTTQSAVGKALVVISSTIASGDVGTKFRDSAVPVVHWEQAIQDDFNMTLNTDGVDRGTTTNQTEIRIILGSHPLAAGLSNGNHAVTTSADTYSWGVPQGNAIIVATLVNDPTRAVIYGYEGGAVMLGGFIAPHRRVMLFMADPTPTVFNPTGQALFNASVEWALNGSGGPGVMQPSLSNPRLVGTTFSVSVPTVSGRTYHLEYKNSLSDASWTVAQSAPGTGASITLQDTAASGAMRFYQVRVQ